MATTSAAPPSSSPGADCVTRTLDGLTLAQRAGQLLMVGTSVNAPSGLGDTVRRYELGGVFLHGRSTKRAAELRADIAGLQKRSELPLLISLDQEGGNVQTLKGADFPLLPSAQKLGAGALPALRNTTRDSAHRLDGIGVNVNLAPVADTVPASLGVGNPPIGYWHRQYGSDPARVAADIRTVVPASQDAGVLTVLKHFPGLGRVRANTDTSTKAVDPTATANDPYLEPFKAGIQAGSASVMMSSAKYPRLDPGAIAAFSRPIVTGLLRERLGFDGLIMSDDLGAAVAVSGVPVGQRAVRFVAAGGDMVLTIRPSDAAPMAGALIERASRDAAFRARVSDGARHVLAAKERAGLLSC
ncbi:glycoside hydrolase family 3 N-terminal domain-containing protein [Paractinoplanes rhizophilus]|uniref:beta-N-acetylhexosaminidase n=1 Tax=Paractinoplanes rhizophilus TaxID=1416877 RepID=A0ABW2I0M9_9ACTN